MAHWTIKWIKRVCCNWPYFGDVKGLVPPGMVLWVECPKPVPSCTSTCGKEGVQGVETLMGEVASFLKRGWRGESRKFFCRYAQAEGKCVIPWVFFTKLWERSHLAHWFNISLFLVKFSFRDLPRTPSRFIRLLLQGEDMHQRSLRDVQQGRDLDGLLWGWTCAGWRGSLPPALGCTLPNRMQHPPVGPSDALWRSEVNSLWKSLLITELSLCGWILAISTATFVCDLLEKLSTFCWYYLHPTANMVFLVLGPFQADCELNREPLSQTHTTCVVRLCSHGVHRGCRMNGRPSRGCGGGGEVKCNCSACQAVAWDGSQGKQQLLPACLPSSRKGPMWVSRGPGDTDQEQRRECSPTLTWVSSVWTACSAELRLWCNKRYFWSLSPVSGIELLKSLEFPWVIGCSVAKSCLTFCDPMDWSMPGFPVPHHLPEFTQIHVYWVGDAFHQFHPLSHFFSFCLQSFPASGYFPVSQLFSSVTGGSCNSRGVPSHQIWVLVNEVTKGGALW